VKTYVFRVTCGQLVLPSLQEVTPLRLIGASMEYIVVDFSCIKCTNWILSSYEVGAL